MYKECNACEGLGIIEIYNPSERSPVECETCRGYGKVKIMETIEAKQNIEELLSEIKNKEKEASVIHQNILNLKKETQALINCLADADNLNLETAKEVLDTIISEPAASSLLVYHLAKRIVKETIKATPALRKPNVEPKIDTLDLTLKEKMLCDSLLGAEKSFGITSYLKTSRLKHFLGVEQDRLEHIIKELKKIGVISEYWLFYCPQCDSESAIDSEKIKSFIDSPSEEKLSEIGEIFEFCDECDDFTLSLVEDLGADDLKKAQKIFMEFKETLNGFYDSVCYLIQGQGNYDIRVDSKVKFLMDYIKFDENIHSYLSLFEEKQ